MGRHPSIRTQMAVLQKGGREARTSWRRLWTDRLGRASLMAVRLHTGRTHQIRVHLAHIGHPLLGDPVYGSPSTPVAGLKAVPLASRQMLHAFRPGCAPAIGEILVPQDPRRFPDPAGALETDCRAWSYRAPGSGKSALLHVRGQPEAPAIFSADAAWPGSMPLAVMARPHRPQLRPRHAER
jgi:23S rRNA pseudouridine1911/1915/1917 synthase